MNYINISIKNDDKLNIANMQESTDIQNFQNFEYRNISPNNFVTNNIKHEDSSNNIREIINKNFLKNIICEKLNF